MKQEVNPRKVLLFFLKKKRGSTTLTLFLSLKVNKSHLSVIYEIIGLHYENSRSHFAGTTSIPCKNSQATWARIM
jgi:hypothetical protein